MSRSRPQFHFREDQSSEPSRQDKTRHRLELSTPHDPKSGIDNSHQITNQPTNDQTNGASKRRLQDHPEWSVYLRDRRILKAAIVAGGWLERDNQSGQDVLVWCEKRRDGSPGATRRRVLEAGKRQAKVRWQYRGCKTDEPFHYVGTLEALKAEIARAAGLVHIVEGEADAWSLRSMGICNVIGIYGITAIPKDIDSIFDELGVTRFVYFADNDAAGEQGASNLRTILHESGWAGVQEYRQFVGPGIPDKGDANDLLRHHFPKTLLARAALEALPTFLPRIQHERVDKPSREIDHDQPGWDAVKEAIRIALGIGLEDFNRKGFSKNFRCLNPHHEDKTPSAAWHKDGFYKCFGCEEQLNAKDMAERLDIDWRPLIRPQPKLVSSTDIDLDAAPQLTEAEPAPLSLDQAPDSWLKPFIKFHTTTDALLFHFALRVCRTGSLAQGFTRQEFIKAVRPLGCNVSERTIYKVFQDVIEHDNHPLLAKLDPSQGSGSRNCKFRLRSLEDIKRRLMHGIRYRVYEENFHKHRDIVIDYQAFTETSLGSKSAITLKFVLEPLYGEQQQRFESLKHLCDQQIAAYQADLENLHATPLPDWTIDKPSELPALLARGIYDADPEDRSKREWARLLGISKASVADTLKRAGIKRRANILRIEVDSQRHAKEQARELGAKIMSVEVGGAHLPYNVAMEIPAGTVAVLQPTAIHEIVSDEKQIIKATPAKPRLTSPEETTTVRADNMGRPGNWHKPSWDPQFIYWELVKACCLLHGYEVRDDVGISDPQTGEVWPNPTLHEVISLITGDTAAADPDTKQQPM